MNVPEERLQRTGRESDERRDARQVRAESLCFHIVSITPPDVRSPDALTHRHSIRRSVRRLTDMAQLCSCCQMGRPNASIYKGSGYSDNAQPNLAHANMSTISRWFKSVAL